MKYWVFDGNQPRGPFDLEYLKSLKGFSPDTFVVPEGTTSADQWRAAKTFPELHGIFAAPPPSSPPTSPAPADKLGEIEDLAGARSTHKTSSAAPSIESVPSYRNNLLVGFAAACLGIVVWDHWPSGHNPTGRPAAQQNASVNSSPASNPSDARDISDHNAAPSQNRDGDSFLSAPEAQVSLRVVAHQWRLLENNNGSYKWSWRAQIKNLTIKRREIYVGYELLDKAGMRVENSNHITNIGPNETIDVTNEGFLEERLEKEIKGSRVVVNDMEDGKEIITTPIQAINDQTERARDVGSMVEDSKVGPTRETFKQKIVDIKSARRAAIGTWTDITPGNPLWLRFVILEGGACEGYQAAPVNDDWGVPKKCRWKSYTGKYEDTGHRYYGIAAHFGGPNSPSGLGGVPAWNLTFMSNDDLSATATYSSIVIATLHRGDAFPFSK